MKKQKKNNRTDNWIIPCDSSAYDIDRAFDYLGIIDYRQNANIKKGSTAYIYKTGQCGYLAFECVVIEPDTTLSINDDKYLLKEGVLLEATRYMKIKMVRRIGPEGLTFKDLKSHGLTGSLQSQQRTSIELQDYIDSIINR